MVSGCPGRGQADSPRSRMPRHVAHGQADRSAITGNSQRMSSSKVTVTDRSRTMSMSTGSALT